MVQNKFECNVSRSWYTLLNRPAAAAAAAAALPNKLPCVSVFVAAPPHAEPWCRHHQGACLHIRQQFRDEPRAHHHNKA